MTNKELKRWLATEVDEERKEFDKLQHEYRLKRANELVNEVISILGINYYPSRKDFEKAGKLHYMKMIIRQKVMTSAKVKEYMGLKSEAEVRAEETNRLRKERAGELKRYMKAQYTERISVLESIY